jgi:hypothetical protein
MATFNLNLKGTEITVRKTELTAKSSTLGKLGDTYTEHAKLVYCFDVSSSMSAQVAKSYISQYAWTPALMATIRARIESAIDHCNAIDPMAVITGAAELDPEDETLLKLVDPTPGPNGLALGNVTDEELQERIVRDNLMAELNVPMDFSKKQEQPPSRMDLMKRCAKSEIEKRFKKYPASRVAVIEFGSAAELAFDDGKPEQLWPVLNRMYEYGHLSSSTDIMGAIRAAVETCRAKPSVVGIHHVIITSDGCDGGTYAIESWIPMLKASGVVLDYIHIGDMEGNEPLRKACEALGGEYVVVNSEKDFEERFAIASARLMLPSGGK